MEILLVRHGQSEGNIVDYDFPDPELTELGRLQAARLAERLVREKLDAIYCSPLLRALSTAVPAARHHNLQVQAYPLLREFRSFGPVYCYQKAVLQQKYPDVCFNDIKDANSRLGWHYPGYENYDQCRLRALDFMKILQRLHIDSDRVLVVAHGGFNASFLLTIMGLSPDRVDFTQQNTCINRLLLQQDRLQIITINDACHLDGLT